MRRGPLIFLPLSSLRVLEAAAAAASDAIDSAPKASLKAFTTAVTVLTSIFVKAIRLMHLYLLIRKKIRGYQPGNKISLKSPHSSGSNFQHNIILVSSSVYRGVALTLGPPSRRPHRTRPIFARKARVESRKCHC